MAWGKKKVKQAPIPVAGTGVGHVVLKPPGIFTGVRWGFFCATVAIAIGMLAMLDQHLVDLPWVYDGPQKQWQGRSVKISYCLLSPSEEASADINCNFGFATASVSLAISLVWSYMQALRRNPFRHPRSKWLDLLLALTGVAWWIASAVILSVWTDRANKAGLPRGDWRNGLCVLAWAQVLFFAGLAATSALLCTAKSQGLFDRYRQKKIQQEEAKLRKMKQDVEAQDSAAAATAAAAAAKPASAGPTAARGPAAGPQHQGAPLPVSTNARAATGGSGPAADGDANPFLPAAEGPAGGAGDDNPFRAAPAAAQPAAATAAHVARK